MPTVTTEIYLDDFDDDDLVRELESRGYKVANSQKEFYADVIWHFRNNRIKEAMIALERIEPELMGISDKAICVSQHRNLVKALEEILKEITPGVSGYYIFERIAKEALNEYC